MRLAAFLKTEGLATDADLQGIAQEIQAKVNAAADLALGSAKPTIDTVELYV